MKTKEQHQAIQLRHQGLSYREIQSQLPVSRGSLSRWLRDIQLTDDQRARFDHTNALIRARFVEYNRRKRADAAANRAAIVERAARDIDRLTVRELRLVGTALY